MELARFVQDKSDVTEVTTYEVMPVLKFTQDMLNDSTPVSFTWLELFEAFKTMDAVIDEVEDKEPEYLEGQ